MATVGFNAGEFARRRRTLGSASRLSGRSSPAFPYSIALVRLGLLTTTGFILAIDTYALIMDNPHGIFDMSGIIHEERASRTLAWMDAIGNTTKALTKGLAIATALIAAISLFRSFIEEGQLLEHGTQINLPGILAGLLLGGAVPLPFSAPALKAVGRAAFGVVEDVRRQFREKPGIMQSTEKPGDGRCAAKSDSRGNLG